MVRGEDLARILQEFVREYKYERPSTDKRTQSLQGSRRDGMIYFGHTQYIAHWAGIQTRHAYDFIYGKHEYVTLRMAERLLMAIDRDYELSNGNVPVIPNPRWTQEYWIKYMRERGCETD